MPEASLLFNFILDIASLSLNFLSFSIEEQLLFLQHKTRMYEKINVIVINSIFDMGILDNAIGIKTTRHIIKYSFSSVLW